MGKVRVAIVGVGNCASSLVQGLEYYKDADDAARVPGLMHVRFGERAAAEMVSYTLELQRHGLESVEREVRWLNELIASERQSEQSETSNPGGPYPPAGQTDTDRGSEKESS